MDIYSSFIEALEKGVKNYGNINRLSVATGIPDITIKRWLDKKAVPSLVTAEKVAPYIQWSVIPANKAVSTSLEVVELQHKIEILEAINQALKEAISDGVGQKKKSVHL